MEKISKKELYLLHKYRKCLIQYLNVLREEKLEKASLLLAHPCTRNSEVHRCIGGIRAIEEILQTLNS